MDGTCSGWVRSRLSFDGRAVRWVAQEVPDKDIRAGRLWRGRVRKTKILGVFLRHVKSNKEKGIDLERQVAHFLCFRMTQMAAPGFSIEKCNKQEPRLAMLLLMRP